MILGVLFVLVRGSLDKSSPPTVDSRSGATNPRPLVTVCSYINDSELYVNM